MANWPLFYSILLIVIVIVIVAIVAIFIIIIITFTSFTTLTFIFPNSPVMVHGNFQSVWCR